MSQFKKSPLGLIQATLLRIIINQFSSVGRFYDEPGRDLSLEAHLCDVYEACGSPT